MRWLKFLFLTVLLLLDISVQAQVLQMLKRIQQERGLSYLLISHDKQIVAWFCDRYVKLQNKRIVEE